MKILISLLFAIIGGTAIAAEPSYTCNPERGCKEEQGPVYDIGRGAELTLPPGWTFFAYPTAPIPIMAGLREVRAFKSGTVIAITPFPNIDQRTFSEAQLCDMVSQASQPYVKVSKEQMVATLPIFHDGIVGCRVSFTAAQEGEKPFAVLPNRHYASVSTYIFSHKAVVFSISVVSEQLPDEDYRAATKAIEQLQ